MATKATTDNTTLNVWQKLLLARKMFLEKGAKKSGKNMALEFKYFELDDIVPLAIDVFEQVGLIAIPCFDKEIAKMTVYNTDKPDESIEFTSPMEMPETNRGVNPMQALGAAHTYLRRYLYMMVLDICEPDSVEPTIKKDGEETPAPEKPKAKKPATTEERSEIKKNLTGADENADDLQINSLKAACKKLREIDPTQEEFVQTIAIKTERFTKISKDACTTLTAKISEMIDNYNLDEEEEQ